MTQYFNEKDYPIAWYFLQQGTQVDEYVIESAIGGGGFSSVYLARQRWDGQLVVIKEYLPRRLAHRTWGNLVVPNSDETRALFLMGRKLFLEEAVALTKFRHPSIVEVLNFFQANSTVYLVMTYEFGRIMGEYLKGKGNMSESFMLRVFPALLEGVKVIHEQGFLHLDIKPHNILIRPGGEPLLLDFGAIQPYPYIGMPKSSKISSSGFSPIEQYHPTEEDRLWPWSDIYAVGASMRMCLDGRTPPPATERVVKDRLTPAAKVYRGKYATFLLEAVDAATRIKASERPQSTSEMLRLLKAG